MLVVSPVPVAKLTLELEIIHAQSLKDRRQVVRSIRDTLRRGFNVSVAELDEGLVWNRATLGIVALSRSATYVEGQLQQAEQAARRACVRYGADITDSYMELLSADTTDLFYDQLPAQDATGNLLQPLPDQVTSVPPPEAKATPEPAPNSAIVSVLEDRNA